MQSRERTRRCPRLSWGTGGKCLFSRVCELKNADQKTFKFLSASSPHLAVAKGQQPAGWLPVNHRNLMKGKKNTSQQ